MSFYDSLFCQYGLYCLNEYALTIVQMFIHIKYLQHIALEK